MTNQIKALERRLGEYINATEIDAVAIKGSKRIVSKAAKKVVTALGA